MLLLFLSVMSGLKTSSLGGSAIGTYFVTVYPCQHFKLPLKTVMVPWLKSHSKDTSSGGSNLQPKDCMTKCL